MEQHRRQLSGRQPQGGCFKVDDQPPVVSQLTIHSSRKVWLEDGQPWRYRGVTAFALLDRYAKGEDVQPFLDAYSGYNVLRVFPYVPRKDWGDHGWDKPSVSVTHDFLRDMAQRGWRVKMDALTDDDSANLQWAKGFIEDISEEQHPNLLWAAGNEPSTHKAIDVDKLRAVLAASGAPYSSGRYEEELTYWGSYGLDHPRSSTDWVRGSHGLMEWFEGTGPEIGHQPYPMPWIVDEMLRPDSPLVRGPDDYLAYGAGCALFGAGCTMHTQSGKWALLPGQFPSGVTGSPLEAECIAAMLKGLTAFPADAPLGAYQHGDAEKVDEQRTGSDRTYRVGPYGVRCRPTDGSPVLIGGETA